MANYVQGSCDNAVITFLVGDTQYADKVATFSLWFRDDNLGGTNLTFDWTDPDTNLRWEIRIGPYTNNSWIPPQGGSKTPMGADTAVETYLQFPQSLWGFPLGQLQNSADVAWLEVPQGWIGDWKCTITGTAAVPWYLYEPEQPPVSIKFISVAFTVTAAGITPAPDPPHA